MNVTKLILSINLLINASLTGERTYCGQGMIYYFLESVHSCLGRIEHTQRSVDMQAIKMIPYNIEDDAEIFFHRIYGHKYDGAEPPSDIFNLEEMKPLLEGIVNGLSEEFEKRSENEYEYILEHMNENNDPIHEINVCRICFRGRLFEEIFNSGIWRTWDGVESYLSAPNY